MVLPTIMTNLQFSTGNSPRITLTRTGAVIMRGKEVLCRDRSFMRFVPIDEITSNDQIRIYDSVSKAESVVHNWFPDGEAVFIREEMQFIYGDDN